MAVFQHLLIVFTTKTSIGKKYSWENIVLFEIDRSFSAIIYTNSSFLTKIPPSNR